MLTVANGCASPAVTGSPLLGGPFGELVTIDAEPFVTEPGKGEPAQMLRVFRIGERAAPRGLCIEWTYGGWLAEMPAETGRNGFVIESGRRYPLRGYETGSWCGLARLPSEAFDEFGPPQARTFGFRNWFRVVDGERLGDARD